MVNGTKYVTIATDASQSTTHDIATWACYIRTPRGTIKHSARFTLNHASTHMLETKALANALVLAERTVNLSEHKIIIYNEVSHVLRPLKTKKAGLPRQKDAERTAIINEVMLPILQKAGSYELRDVKAHSPKGRREGAPKRFYMNRWCDLACRKLLRRLVRSQYGIKEANKVQ